MFDQTPSWRLREESVQGTRYIRKRSGSPLVHHYRLASSDPPMRLRRSTSFRTNLVQFPLPRSVSFEGDVARSTPSRDVEVTSASALASGDRKTEYRLFLTTLTTVTITITLLQPFLLYQYLVQCTEPRCYTVALTVRDTIEPSVSPCQDFLKYSCSGNNSNLHDKVKGAMQTSALRWISTILVAPRQSAVQKAGILFRNCMKLVNQKPEQMEKIRAALMMGDLKFPRMPTTTSFYVLRSVVDLNLNLGIAVLFRLTVGQNLKQKDRYMFYLTTNDDLKGFAQYLNLLEASNHSLEVYVRRCAEVIGERGMSYARLVKAIRHVNRVLQKIAAAAGDHTTVFYADRSVRGLLWTGIFKSLLKEFRTMPNVSRELFVINEDYFVELNRTLFAVAEASSVSAYIGLYVVWYLGRLGSHSLSYSTPVEGYTSDLNDIWPRCFGDVYQ